MGLAIVLLLSSLGLSFSNTDIPCEWKSKSGFHYDLRPLTIKSSTDASYYIKDGDIPCTPEEEPTFSWAWNFCQPVTEVSMPSACSKMNKAGVALQWLEFSNGFYDCNVIGRYDPKQDDLSYSLLDVTDPTKGISMAYPLGDRCTDKGVMRKATIDVQCANVKATVLTAQEPTECDYHLVMQSYHGCPTECPITKNGLCNSHGLCQYDSVNKAPYCYCNEGYYGPSCSDGAPPPPTTYDGYSVQLGLLITLLIIALGLVGVVAYMVYRITVLRKEHSTDYSALPSGSEMVETVHF